MAARSSRAVSTRNRDNKIFDGAGLCLIVAPTGSKLWRFKYQFGGGREKLLPVGWSMAVSGERRIGDRDPNAVDRAVQGAAGAYRADIRSVLAKSLPLNRR